jgi:FkbM family methyltransferase
MIHYLMNNIMLTQNGPLSVLRQLSHCGNRNMLRVLNILTVTLFAVTLVSLGTWYYITNSSMDVYFIPADLHLHYLKQDSDPNDHRRPTLPIRKAIIGHSRLPYSLNGAPHVHSQAGQVVLDILRNRRNGFFVECGASNGATLSNTLLLEKQYGWDGLLIEADPKLFMELLAKGRKAYSINTCLNPKRNSREILFHLKGSYGSLDTHYNPSDRWNNKRKKDNSRSIVMLCYPLHDIMAELGRTHIDYLSLDVEGLEFDILKTIPFDDITIDVISVEYKVMKTEMSPNLAASLRKLNNIQRFMTSTKLYVEHSIVHIPKRPSFEFYYEASGLDVIFRRKDLDVK